MPEQFMTVPQVAAQIGVDPTTVYRWIREGRVQAYRIPGTRTTRISASTVAALFAPVVEK